MDVGGRRSERVDRLFDRRWSGEHSGEGKDGCGNQHLSTNERKKEGDGREPNLPYLTSLATL